MLGRIFIIYLILQPVFNKFLSSTSTLLSSLDQFFILIFGSAFLIKIVYTKTVKTRYLYIIIPAGYFLFLWFYNSLPARNILQIFLYIQIFIIYTWFNSNKYIYKNKQFHFLFRSAKIIFYISIIFVFVNIIEPGLIKGFYGIPPTYGRGFDGISITSFFGTRTAYSQFLLIFIVLVVFNRNLTKKYRNIFLLISFVLLMMTFSRKETLVACLILITLFWKKIDRSYIKLLIPILFGSIIIFYYLSFFNQANAAIFEESYIRWRIADYSFQIIEDFFPFGSGPGTFGSQLSMSYSKIYDLYNVPKAITGTVSERGPIFDSFIFSFTAEIGIGIIFYIYYYYKIYKAKLLYVFKGLNHIKLVLIISIFLLSFFNPMIMNPVGFTLILILALVNR